MANTSIRRTNSGNGNRKKWTVSWWEKKNKLGAVQRIFSCDEAGNNNHDDFFQWQTDDKLVIGFYDSGYYLNLTPDRNFRDTNGWYHFVFTWDTAQATASDRAKFYINGVRETVFATETYPSQNQDSFINTTEPIEIGKRSDNDTQYLESTLSHIHFCDGYAYTPSDFGSTDSTTGEWKINTSPSVSYGTNGFFILKDGNSLTDESPNSNNWSSVSGTLTNTEDCPDNVFCTLNPLDCDLVSGLSNGNNTFSGFNTGTDYSATSSTLSASSGKFYWEAKVTDLAEIDQVGVRLQNGVSMSIQGSNGSAGLQGTAYGGKSVQFSNGNKAGDGAQSAYMGGFSANDIIMVALDLDNNKITFGRNGQWSDGSGNANQTYANSTAAFTNLTAGEFYCPAQTSRSYGSNPGTTQYNFGNGYFGTTAISSEGTNASNIGKFEYDIPSGFTALSTKGLNE